MRSVLILPLVFLAVALSSAQAEPASIEGWWRGSGIVTYGNGADNVQCRVRPAQQSPFGDGDEPAGIGSAALGKAWLSC
jgi:hypothetical protein